MLNLNACKKCFTVYGLSSQKVLPGSKIRNWLSNVYKNEPRHDKTNKVSVRPAKTQIILGIRPVLSESAVRMPRLIWVFAGRTIILLVLSCRGSNEVQQQLLGCVSSLQRKRFKFETQFIMHANQSLPCATLISYKNPLRECPAEH